MTLKPLQNLDRMDPLLRLAFAVNPAAGLALAPFRRSPQPPAPRPGPDPEANLGYISRGHDRFAREQAEAEARRKTQPVYPNIRYSPLDGPIEDGVRYNEKTPTNGQPNPYFGPAVRMLKGQPRAHWGVDLAAEIGSPAYAVNSGVVVQVANGGGFGQHVVIDFGDGYGALYAHLSDTAGLKVGDRVSAGQKIGKTGRSGIDRAQTNPHLHFELRRGRGSELLGPARPPGGQSKSIDPMPYLGYRR